MTGPIDWRNSLLVGSPDVDIARNVLIAVQLLFDTDFELLIRAVHERTRPGEDGAGVPTDARI